HTRFSRDWSSDVCSSDLPDRNTVDTTANCGNMLAAVVPFALERGLIQAQGDETTARVLTRNTGMQCDITVLTPMTPEGRRVSYEIGRASCRERSDTQEVD